ncbi:MBL fold metallo-hydrolase [Aestuariibacter sp. AA17]|uniref:MBL fold metallo-hydrolase n=1 Tax=Fluctibacter corallii TaxID=2984329 RepID=A0ABT3A8N2_9ALTE|nr:MBL fold metallo-hydrolase [Aestuariibacter sp. AA17]MCV2885021.1 MBL fold metallo-hydrolase [Aestuariibacter sp. AA17]
MQVTFYGVRGSVPVSGQEYIQYGGNTACTYVELDDGTHFILDAGTGIVNLGHRLKHEKGDIHLLLSHNHWDHIQGFPFFAPAYQDERNIYITPGETDPFEPDAILTQMSGSQFPVHYQDLKANIVIASQTDLEYRWQVGSATVSRAKMNHPGNGSAYKIEADGAILAYITDNELYPPYKKQTDFLDWVHFAQNADLIIHDAQYLLADMPTKSGWGHSVAEEAVKLAMASRAKRLALYSHDNNRTDAQIADIEAQSKELTDIAHAEIDVFAAAEGMTIKL